MSVLAIGLSVFDTTVVLNEEMIFDMKYRVSDKYECAGGQASTAACVCGKWGLKTYMMSRIGEDASGNAILNSFKSLGVDTSCMSVLKDYTTSASFIINHQDCGKRTILNYQDPVEEIDFTLPEDVDFILLDAHEEKIGMAAFEKFKNASSMLDAERANELTLKYAQKVDYIVGSEKFAKEYTGLDVVEENYQMIIDEIRKLNNKHVVITLGERGLIYEVEGKVHHMDAYKVDVVDTTGAGDIFHGALLYALHENYAYEDALRLAACTASLSVQKRGGSTSIPTLEEVEMNIYNK